MAKVYIEFDDRHNGPMIETYADKSAAIVSIWERAFMATAEEVDAELFGEESTGEFHSGTDKWSVITGEVALSRCRYWQAVGQAIAEDREAP